MPWAPARQQNVHWQSALPLGGPGGGPPSLQGQGSGLRAGARRVARKMRRGAPGGLSRKEPAP